MVGLPEPLPDDAGRTLTGLASLAPEALVDETALARHLAVTKRTVRRMVARYELPPPVRLAGRATWRVGRVLAWIEARADKAEREVERKRARLKYPEVLR